VLRVPYAVIAFLRSLLLDAERGNANSALPADAPMMRRSVDFTVA